jgi:hypothetical protein
MKLKRFNESWEENAYNRKEEYFDLLDDVLDAIIDETGSWKDDEEWHYTAEMYDLLKSLIDNLGRFSGKLEKDFLIKLEKINDKQ